MSFCVSIILILSCGCENSESVPKFWRYTTDVLSSRRDGPIARHWELKLIQVDMYIQRLCRYVYHFRRFYFFTLCVQSCTLHIGDMVIGSIVKYHIWLILSWSEVGSLINENDRLYGLSLIWSILVGQNSGPCIWYAVYYVTDSWNQPAWWPGILLGSRPHRAWSSANSAHCRSNVDIFIQDENTRCPVRLTTSFCWHQSKSSITV